MTLNYYYTNALVIGYKLINVTATINTQTTENYITSFGFHSCINRAVEVLATVFWVVLFIVEPIHLIHSLGTVSMLRNL